MLLNNLYVLVRNKNTGNYVNIFTKECMLILQHILFLHTCLSPTYTSNTYYSKSLLNSFFFLKSANTFQIKPYISTYLFLYDYLFFNFTSETY